MSKALVLAASDEIFDARPIELPGFQLRARSVVVVGKPSKKQWLNAIAFAKAANDASPYWIGDLLRYAEGREDWRETFDQLLAETGLAAGTLHNYQWIATHVEPPERALAPTPAHAQEVAPLPRPEQTKYLKAARDENMTRRELRQRIKGDKRKAVIDGQAVLEGMYRVIYADPPWDYGDSLPSGSNVKHKYPPMTIDEMCQLPVAAHALPNSVLLMWTTAPWLMLNPGPRDVIEAWGFKYKTNVVWDKVLGNYGHYFRVHHEHLLIATRGSCLPDEPTPQPDSVQVIRRGDEHSAKPEEMRQTIVKLYTRGPYLELFGRERVEGWSVFGNDARLWAMEAGGQS